MRSTKWLLLLAAVAICPLGGRAQDEWDVPSATIVP
jgi:hypothetical protein